MKAVEEREREREGTEPSVGVPLALDHSLLSLNYYSSCFCLRTAFEHMFNFDKYICLISRTILFVCFFAETKGRESEPEAAGAAQGAMAAVHRAQRAGGVRRVRIRLLHHHGPAPPARQAIR